MKVNKHSYPSCQGETALTLQEATGKKKKEIAIAWEIQEYMVGPEPSSRGDKELKMVPLPH